MNWVHFLPLLGIGGIIGGIVGAFFQSRFQHQKQLKEWEHELKKKRYLSINIFLLTKIDIERGMPFLQNVRPDILTEKQLDKEIEVEFYNSLLFASADVISELNAFDKDPSYSQYYRVAVAMRRDLWSKKNVPELPIFQALFEGGMKRLKA